MGFYKYGSTQFTITATNIAALDTTLTGLHTFAQPSDRIFIPKLLILRYKAGVNAFTVTRNANMLYRMNHPHTNVIAPGKGSTGVPYQRWEAVQEFKDGVPVDDDYLLFSFTKESRHLSTVVEDLPVFYVSMRDLGLLGTTDTSVVATPLSNGAVYINDKYSLAVKGSGSTYAGGTGRSDQTEGKILGDLHYEEWFVG